MTTIPAAVRSPRFTVNSTIRTASKTLVVTVSSRTVADEKLTSTLLDMFTTALQKVADEHGLSMSPVDTSFTVSGFTLNGDKLVPDANRETSIDPQVFLAQVQMLADERIFYVSPVAYH
jgi:hypothetical protein